MPFEIIEIGAVKLDPSFHELGTFHETIRPVLYKKLHYMTRNVIHMTEKDFQGLTPADFAPYLVTAGIPDPDLLIRTSGELRISNYLLWQCAYTEFYFSDVLWPDFRKPEFREAIRAYAQRDRRYGKVK